MIDWTIRAEREIEELQERLEKAERERDEALMHLARSVIEREKAETQRDGCKTALMEQERAREHDRNTVLVRVTVAEERETTLRTALMSVIDVTEILCNELHEINTGMRWEMSLDVSSVSEKLAEWRAILVQDPTDQSEGGER